MKKRTLASVRRRGSVSSRRIQERRKKRARTLLFEQMEDRRMLDATPWHNMMLAEDVDNNGQVNASDATIINGMLSANGGNPIPVPMNGSGPPYPDVNGDWFVSQTDSQLVNGFIGGEGSPPSYPPPGNPPPGGPPPGPPPTISITSSSGSVNEMQVFTIGGTFTWAYYIDVRSLGSEYHMIGGNFPGGMSGSWSMTGYFSDDNGSNTSSDSRTLRLEVGNNTIYKGVAFTSITVNNVAPSAMITSNPDGFDEGAPASITVNVFDGSNAYVGGHASDAYGFEIDWGDGQTDEIPVAEDIPDSDILQFLSPGATLPPPPNPPPGYTQFGFSHIYKDDNPTATPQDYYTVHVTVIDDDTGVGGGNGQVLIKNVKPVVSISSAVANEGEQFQVFGTIHDAGILDTHDGVIKVDSNGDGDMDDPGETQPIQSIMPAGTPGDWIFEGLSAPIPDDGPSNLAWESNHTKFDDMPIRVEIYDDDMLRAPSGAPVGANGYATIFNVPPKIQSAVATPTLYDVNGFPTSVVVDIAFTDVGVLDCHKARIYFSDNTFVDAGPVSPGQHSFTFYAQTTNANSQPHWPMKVTVFDDDSGQDTAPVTPSGVSMWVPDAYASETKAPGNVDDDGEIMFARAEGQAVSYQIGIFFQINRQVDPANPDPSFADINSDYTVDGAVESASDPTLWYTTIPSNAASTSVRIIPVDDQVLEWDEKVVVRFGGEQKTITIFDNEGFGGLQNRNLDRDSTSLSRDAVGNGAISVDPYEGQFVYGVDIPGAVGPNYNGDDNLHPLLPVEWQLPPVGSGGQAVPTALSATSNFGGLTGGNTTFNVTSQVHNDTGKLRYLVSASDASSLATGHYDYNIKFTASYSTDTWPRVRTIRGSTEIVNTRDATHGDTAFGAGWRLDELDRLVPDDGNSAQFTDKGLAAIGGQGLVRGDNTSAFFPATLVDKTVNNAPEYLTPDGLTSYQWITGTYSSQPYKYTTGSDIAKWTVDSLVQNQQYQVFATWVPGPSRSQFAHYKVKDHAVGSPDEDKTITVDQRYTPGEVTSDNLKWRSLGFFTPDADGKIIVELTGGYDGATVAQSIMVVKSWTFDKTPLGSFSALAYQDGPASGDPKEFVLSDKFGGKATFDAQGLLQQRKDRNDNVTKYEYSDADSDGLDDELEKITRQGGLETTFHYASGDLESIEDFSGRFTNYTINNHRLTRIELPAPGLGSTTRPAYEFGYNSVSQLNSIKDPRGVTGNYATSIEYASNRVKKVTNPDSYFWELTPFLVDGLSTGGNAPIRKPATGLIGQRESDANLPQNALKEPRATFTDGRTSKWYYQTDTFGLTTALAKPAMNPSSSDSFERRADVWRWERRPDGLPTKSYEPAGGGGYDQNLGELTTTYKYGPANSTDDKFGNLREIDYPDTTVEKWEYDPTFFLVTKHIDPLLFTTRYVLDYTGNVADIFENDTGLAGSDGQVIRRRTHFTYTPSVSNINQLPHGLLQDTTVAYGTSDAVTTSNAYYDQANDKRIGLLKSVTYAVGTAAEASTGYDYDAHRNPESVTDELLRVTQFMYDDLDRLVYTLLPDPGTGDHAAAVTKNTYDLSGNLIYAAPSSPQGGTWDDTARIRYDYDKLNRVEWEYIPGSTASVNQTGPLPTQYLYDANGNLEHVIVAGSRVTDYQYDQRNQLVKEQSPQPSYSNLGTGIVVPSDALQRPTVETKYDTLGNVRFVTDARDFLMAPGGAKVKTKYFYDKQSQLIETRQPARSSIEGHNEPISKIEYDDAGRVEGTLSPGPDTSGQATVASGRGYDSLGRLEREIMPPDALGRTLVKRYAYDLRDNLVSVSLYDGTSPLGIVTTNFYDARDRLVGVDEPDPDGNTPGLVTLSAIDAAGNTRATLTYAGNTSAGNVVSGGAGPSAFGLWFQYGVLAFSNIKAQLTQFGVDNLNRTVQIIAPDPDLFGPQWSVETDQEYDALGNVRHTDTILHENGGVTTLSSDVLFDNRGQAYHTYGPANSDGVRPETITHFNYDGTVGSIDEKNVNPGEGDFTATWRTTSFSYDELGRRYMTVAPLGLTSYAFQDALGNVVLQISPNGETQIDQFDVLGRLSVSTTFVAEAIIPNSVDRPLVGDNHYTWYYANGQVREQKTSAQNASTGADIGGDFDVATYQYDYRGNVLQKQRTNNSNNESTSYTYDVLGNIASVTDPLGNETTYAHDRAGRQTLEEITLNGVALKRNQRFDAFGNLVQTVDRNGRTIQFSYDNLDHRNREEWFDTTAAQRDNIPVHITNEFVKVYDAAFNYDSSGNLDEASDTKLVSGQMAFNSSYSVSYDSLRRPDLIAQDLGVLPGKTFTFNYSHDLLGRLTSRKLYEGANLKLSTSYQFDDQDRPDLISEAGAWAAPKGVDYVYSGANLSRIDRLGVGPGNVVSHTTFWNQADGRLGLISHFVAGSSNAVDTVALHYNYQGLIGRTVIGQDGVRDHAYDDKEQLTKVIDPAAGGNTAETFDFDVNGNRVGITAGYNRLTADSTHGFDYDSEGNVIRRTTFGLESTLSFHFDDGAGALLDTSGTDDLLEPGWFRVRILPFEITASQNPGPAKISWKLREYQLLGVDPVIRLGEFPAVPVTAIDGKLFTSSVSEVFNLANSVNDVYLEVSVEFPQQSVPGQVQAQGDVQFSKLTEQEELTWDYRDRLQSVYSIVSSQSWSEIRYSYDVMGNLVARTEHTSQGAQVGGEYYVNEGGSRLLKFDASGQAQEHYLHAPSVDTLLALDDINYSPEGNISLDLLWALTDHQGTVRDIARSGQPTVHLTYDAFGRPHGLTSNQNLPIDELFSGYMGMPWDEEVGLYLAASRAYDPVAGRYLGMEPSSDQAGSNPYVFAGNTPINRQAQGIQSEYNGTAQENPLSAYYSPEMGHAALDAIGVLDPTGIADGANAVWYLAERRYPEAGISAVSALLPYVGDFAKAGKVAVKSGLRAGVKELGASVKQTFKSVSIFSHAASAECKAVGYSRELARFKNGARQSIYGGTTGAALGGAIGYARTGTLEGAGEGARSGALHGAVGGFTNGWLKRVACFPAGTHLKTPTGSKPIEQFIAGDKIISRDEHDVTAPLVTSCVEEVFVREAFLLNLRVGGQLIQTTAEHPFYVKGFGWLPAGELRPGDQLSTSDGRWIAVERLEASGMWATVYNLRVADCHTYFVGHSEWMFDIWAHNSYTAEELAAVNKWKSSKSSALSDGSAGYSDMLGFPVRHPPHEGDGHLLRMRDVANERIRSVEGTIDDTVVLYNKTLRDSADPFSVANYAIKPDVQVFQKTGKVWNRVGLPVEVERLGNQAAIEKNIAKYNSEVGLLFDLETY